MVIASYIVQLAATFLSLAILSLGDTLPVNDQLAFIAAMIILHTVMVATFLKTLRWQWPAASGLFTGLVILFGLPGFGFLMSNEAIPPAFFLLFLLPFHFALGMGTIWLLKKSPSNKSPSLFVSRKDIILNLLAIGGATFLTGAILYQILGYYDGYRYLDGSLTVILDFQNLIRYLGDSVVGGFVFLISSLWNWLMVLVMAGFSVLFWKKLKKKDSRTSWTLQRHIALSCILISLTIGITFFLTPFRFSSSKYTYSFSSLFTFFHWEWDYDGSFHLYTANLNGTVFQLPCDKEPVINSREFNCDKTLIISTLDSPSTSSSDDLAQSLSFSYFQIGPFKNVALGYDPITHCIGTKKILSDVTNGRSFKLVGQICSPMNPDWNSAEVWGKVQTPLLKKISLPEGVRVVD